MSDTARYSLPLLEAGQAQKEVTHNEAIARLDALLHLVVESRHVSPVATVGTTWIVPAGATGDLAAHAGALAAFDDAGRLLIAPRDGCIAFVRDEAAFVHFAAGAWRDDWSVGALRVGGRGFLAGAVAPIGAPSGGSVIDIEARAALTRLVAALAGLGLVGAG